MRQPTLLHRLAAEFIGTFWLVLGGCGSAVFAAKFDSDGTALGIGFLGVAIAFGLTVLTGVYAFGTISGGHFNPAVTLGAALARRVALPAYWGHPGDRRTHCRSGDLSGGQRQGRVDCDGQHGSERFR
jgi:aquaporin Z